MMVIYKDQRYTLTVNQFELLRKLAKVGWIEMRRDMPPRARGSINSALRRLRNAGFITDSPHELTELGNFTVSQY